MKDQRRPDTRDAESTSITPNCEESFLLGWAGELTIIMTEAVMITTITTRRQLNFSNLKSKPKSNTNTSDEVFTIVYRLRLTYWNDTLERPISPAEARPHGMIWRIYASHGIENEGGRIRGEA